MNGSDGMNMDETQWPIFPDFWVGLFTDKYHKAIRSIGETCVKHDNQHTCPSQCVLCGSSAKNEGALFVFQTTPVNKDVIACNGHSMTFKGNQPNFRGSVQCPLPMHL